MKGNYFFTLGSFVQAIIAGKLKPMGVRPYYEILLLVNFFFLYSMKLNSKPLFFPAFLGHVTWQIHSDIPFSG